MMHKLYASLLIFCCSLSFSFGQETNSSPSENTYFFKNNIDYQVRAFFAIGGSSPLGFPQEIRSIEHYNPKLQLGLEVNATKWFSDDHKWGLRIGVGVEGKGMGTKARVKNYLTEIIQDNSKVRGFYTGLVQTTVKNSFVNIPVSAIYHLSRRWNVYAGIYASILIDKQFSGYVTDGYLRQGTPVGSKITFEDGSKARYDFSQNEQSFQWGVQIGAEWKLNKHFRLFPRFTYGVNGILDPNFSAISFSMHNIYLDLGFGYQF